MQACFHHSREKNVNYTLRAAAAAGLSGSVRQTSGSALSARNEWSKIECSHYA
jgi:hypothetical protein